MLPKIAENILLKNEVSEAYLNKLNAEAIIGDTQSQIENALLQTKYVIAGSELIALTFARYMGNYDGYLWHIGEITNKENWVANIYIDFKKNTKEIIIFRGNEKEIKPLFDNFIKINKFKIKTLKGE